MLYHVIYTQPWHNEPYTLSPVIHQAVGQLRYQSVAFQGVTKI